MNPGISLAVLWIALTLAVIWMLAPPVLIILALREGWNAGGKGLRTKVIPIAI
jgi:hypothetical protein